MKTILPICPCRDWERAQQNGEYAAASLGTEGIPCSAPEQVAKTANRFYRGQQDLLLLVIAAGRVAAEIRYEAADGGGDLFPHLCGPLNLEAVTDAREFASDADGTFQPPNLA